MTILKKIVNFESISTGFVKEPYFFFGGSERSVQPTCHAHSGHGRLHLCWALHPRYALSGRGADRLGRRPLRAVAPNGRAPRQCRAFSGIALGAVLVRGRESRLARPCPGRPVAARCAPTVMCMWRSELLLAMNTYTLLCVRV